MFSRARYVRVNKEVSIKDAVTFLYKHFNLEVTETEAIASKTILKKKKKEK